MNKDQAIKYPVTGGLYYHYKGGIYKVLGMGKHSETQEVLVIYKSTNFGSLHARPLTEWNKPLEHNENENRFTLISQ